MFTTQPVRSMREPPRGQAPRHLPCLSVDRRHISERGADRTQRSRSEPRNYRRARRVRALRSLPLTRRFGTRSIQI